MTGMTKKIGKHVYNLWGIERNLTMARQEVKLAKEAGYSRSRYLVSSGRPESTNLYTIWADRTSLKGGHKP